VVIVWKLDIQLYVQLVLITTKVVLDTTLCDKVFQWLADLWCSPGTPVSSTSKADRHDITKMLLKVALNIITLTLSTNKYCILARMTKNDGPHQLWWSLYCNKTLSVEISEVNTGNEAVLLRWPDISSYNFLTYHFECYFDKISYILVYISY